MDDERVSVGSRNTSAIKLMGLYSQNNSPESENAQTKPTFEEPVTGAAYTTGARDEIQWRISMTITQI